MILQLSVLPAFPVTLWRLLCYYKPVYLQLPGKLLHLELKHLPRIYAHSVDNGVTWSVFLLRRNRSEPEAPLQIPLPIYVTLFSQRHSRVLYSRIPFFQPSSSLPRKL
ncbi:hypothetical protein F2Q68_00001871 [Brassica cretica]|uniref:Secreted protein n=2 Tax=Brassica cretica TaxID=69181 RepID=A0ABQ7DFL5_BRACR|nr:hypothetical protein F2Q68_00001871 [Brassica cretica]KAF3575804.1 hypothetical protein DY000_02034522 [Brassica cretica]